MVKLTKIYTKRGDGGETDLAGGHRVAKTCARIELIGEIDELNAHIGSIIEGLKVDSLGSDIIQKFSILQNELFNLGAHVCVLEQDRQENTPMINEESIIRLEKEIDAMNENLPSLKSFILPGGSEPAARIHLARTVCRRVERSALRASEQDDIDVVIIKFLNRLSDWLFVMARYVNMQLNADEVLWQP